MLACSVVVSLAACAPGRTHAPARPAVSALARPAWSLPVERTLFPVRLDHAEVLESPFTQQQLRYPRVREAHAATRSRIEQLFHRQGIPYPAAEVYLRVFKQNRALELWVRPEQAERFQLLRTYRICALAGDLGPKRREGDAQVPEGYYAIDLFNPESDYHLSLRIDYPNRYDRLAAAGVRDLGGDIFIHGGCRSEGCLAITDEGISELYWIAIMARAAGQSQIPVHIYPGRLDSPDWLRVEKRYARQPGLLAFWSSLRHGYRYFETERRVPRVGVHPDGRYQLIE